jgi:hypothetical protein
VAAQIARQQHGSGGSPTVAEQDNVGASFFLSGKHAVAIGIEKSEHRVVGLLPAPILKNANVSPLGNGLPDALSELNRSVTGVVMADKPAHETDDDVRRRCGSFGAKSRGVYGS